jgi:hypothetical protein
MEKYKEILETIAKTSAEIESTKRSYKELESSITGSSPLERFKNRKALTNDLNALLRKENYLHLVLKLQRYNLQVAALEELKPVIIQILEKYKNKQYGPKTRDKISNEFKELTGFNISFFDKNFYTEIHVINYDYHFSLNIDSDNDHKVLENNRIQVITADHLRMYNVNEYINDIPAYIEKLKEAYTALQEKYKEFDALAHAYNDLCVGNVERVSYCYLDNISDLCRI